MIKFSFMREIFVAFITLTLQSKVKNKEVSLKIKENSFTLNNPQKFHIPRFWLKPRLDLIQRKTTPGGDYHLAEKSGWGIENIMVSDLPVYRRNTTSVTLWIQKKGEFV